jgi:hypothetical protein
MQKWHLKFRATAHDTVDFAVKGFLSDIGAETYYIHDPLCSSYPPTKEIRLEGMVEIAGVRVHKVMMLSSDEITRNTESTKEMVVSYFRHEIAHFIAEELVVIHKEK